MWWCRACGTCRPSGGSSWPSTRRRGGAVPRQLRGIIAYYGEHWVAFVCNASSSDDGCWVTLGDVTVSPLPGGVPELQYSLVEGRLQPAVRLYEMK